jgi:hypothetical protein
MTRISYLKSPTDEMIEYSNLLITNTAVVIFIEIDINNSVVNIKDIEEGKIISSFGFISLDEAKKKARNEVIKLGVSINQEIREKELK